MVTRSYSNHFNQLPDKHNMTGPILQLSSNMEANQQPVLASSSRNLIPGGSAELTGLALGPPRSDQTSPSTPLDPTGMMSVTSGASEWPHSRDSRGQESYGQVVPAEEILTEDEMRARSLEFLENEDMHTQIQQLLRMFNAQAGEIPFSPYPMQGDDPYPYVGVPTDADSVGPHRPRGNSKAFVGWLKLKAALRWGIFIRKRAAAKRAQLEEVEDE